MGGVRKSRINDMKMNNKHKLIEFWCVCAIIVCISGFMYNREEPLKNLLVVVISACVLALIRVVILFYANSRK